MKVLALDCEHSYNSFRPYDKGFYLTCVGLATSWDGETCFFVDHKDRDKVLDIAEVAAHIQKLIDMADIVVAHNLKHDMTILRYYGISFEKVKLHCTMLTEYLLSGQNTRERTFGLSAVCQYYGLPEKLDKVKAYWGDKIETKDIPAHILEEYVLDDAGKALKLFYLQNELIDKSNMRKLCDLQNEYTLSLSDMELSGFKFSTETAQKIIDRYDSLLRGYEIELEGICGYPNLNFGSPTQLSALLYGGRLKRAWFEWKVIELKVRPESYYRETKVTDEQDIEGLGFKPLPRTRLESGYYKTDKETIRKLTCRTPTQKRMKNILLEYSNAKKVKETIKGLGDKGLVNKIRPDGLIHPNYNQTVTATGRLSSSDPNSQNFPRGSTSPIKECIVPTLDEIVEVDLSQIEWRMAAELSQDPVMLMEINSGIDQHSAACVELMELELNDINRTAAKIFNFRMIYGGTAYGFYMDQKMPNFPLKKWERIVDGFYKKYRRLKEWQDTNVVTVEKQGYLKAPTGRLFIFHKVDRKDGLNVYNERQVKNYPVQGVAGGDILPLAAVIIRRGLRTLSFKTHYILTVHDSLVFDTLATERDRLIELCSAVVNSLRVYAERYYATPFVARLEGEIKVGGSYGAMHKINSEDK